MSKVAVFEYYPETTIIKLNRPSGEETEIVINPGWAFGKGNHPTTKLCIKALENLFKNEQIDSVLDVGCGSGVLSIASAALGAKYIVGVDIDNAITLEANSNKDKNGFSSQIKIILGSIEDVTGKFDLVVANILIDSIIAISPEVKERVTAGGTILLSGIKDDQKIRAIDKLSEFWYRLEEEYQEKEWVALVFKQ
ncbi:MAG: 50S ribosomal protein L11 methyltransferase [Thermodesulfobacteriota bacterium]